MKGTLFTNGQIQTLDPAWPQVEALAAVDGRIVAVGSTEELRSTFSSFARIDLGGRPAYPGFIDSHIHLAAYGMSLRRVQLQDAQTLQSAVDRVAQAVGQTGPREWVLGRGWDKNEWPEGRFPSKDDLDPISPTTPVVLTSKDGHLVWVNSVALALAGIDGKTTAPPGGEISKDRRGEPTGVLKEQAKDLIARVVPRAGPEDIEQGIRRATEMAHRLGIVGVHTFEGADVFAAFQRLHERGELALRVWMAIPEENLGAAAACGLRTGFGSDRLRVGPIKIFADGTLGSQTASMLEPFEGQPLNTGIATHSREELVDLVGRAVKAGFWCAIHAIGDRANRWALDAYETHWDASRKAGARHRIEHVQLLHPDDLDRLGRLHVIASMQPIHAMSDREIAERFWGRRSRFAYAWRSLHTRGTRLAFGSDAPVESPDVFQGLYAAVTRRRAHEREGRGWYPDEVISLGEALEAYTGGAAYAAGGDASSGKLTPGRLADLMILDRAILAAPAEALLEARVEATVVGGELVYTAPTFAA